MDRPLRIDGDLGSIRARRDGNILLFSERDDLLPGDQLTEHEIHVSRADTFTLEIDHFLECVRTGAEPITSGRSQRNPLAAVLAAYESMETGKPARPAH